MALFGLFKHVPPDVESLKNQKDVPGLSRATQYKHSADIRKKAADALGILASRDAVAALRLAISHDGDDAVRKAALRALILISLANTGEPFQKAWYDRHTPAQRALLDQSAEQRRAEAAAKEVGAAIAPTTDDHPAAVDRLLGLFDDEDKNVRRVVAIAVEQHIARLESVDEPGRVVPKLLNACSDGAMAEHAARALSSILQRAASRLSPADLTSIINLASLKGVSVRDEVVERDADGQIESVWPGATADFTEVVRLAEAESGRRGR